MPKLSVLLCNVEIQWPPNLRLTFCRYLKKCAELFSVHASFLKVHKLLPASKVLRRIVEMFEYGRSAGRPCQVCFHYNNSAIIEELALKPRMHAGTRRAMSIHMSWGATACAHVQGSLLDLKNGWNDYAQIWYTVWDRVVGSRVPYRSQLGPTWHMRSARAWWSEVTWVRVMIFSE